MWIPKSVPVILATRVLIEFWLVWTYHLFVCFQNKPEPHSFAASGALPVKKPPRSERTCDEMYQKCFLLIKTRYSDQPPINKHVVGFFFKIYFFSKWVFMEYALCVFFPQVKYATNPAAMAKLISTCLKEERRILSSACMQEQVCLVVSPRWGKSLRYLHNNSCL